MKNVGEFMKLARRAKGLTLGEVEEGTKIKAEFVEAIEKLHWQALPEYPVVVGFIKNLSSFYDTSRDKSMALLRRDYPAKSIPTSINPKPDLVEKKFAWKPRLTFLLGVVGIALIVVGYLGYQYYSFTRPPALEIFIPHDNQIVYQELLTVTGQTTGDAAVIVNNQPALVDADGTFRVEINVDETTTKVEVKATSRNGKETIIPVNIQVELDN